MRTIRFRGKSVKTGEWLYGYLQEYQERSMKRLCVCAASVRTWADALWYKVVPYTVGQFTGLYDKNGNGIYEGDIVRIERGQGKYEVVWNNHLCRYIMKDGNFCAPFHPSYRYTVIGNIHDNPELLEGGTDCM